VNKSTPLGRRILALTDDGLKQKKNRRAAQAGKRGESLEDLAAEPLVQTAVKATPDLGSLAP